MLVVWVLEARSKTNELKEVYKEYPPEATHGVCNRTFFVWLNSLFVKGYKGLLTMNDLWMTPPEMASARLRDELQARWDQRRISERHHCLIQTCASCLMWPLLSAVPARVCLIGLNYAQPFLISRMVSFVGEPKDSSQHGNRGLGLVAATALIYVGLAVANVCYMHQLYRSITMLRGGLVGLIFNKTLVLRDGIYDETAAITHMSTDIDRIAASMPNVHEIWARFAEVAIGMWLLATQLGAIAVVPIIVVLVCGVINILASKKNSKKQKIWSGAVQTRISSTASMLGSMKSVKMMGLAGWVYQSIENQRIKEMKDANGYKYQVIFTNTVGSVPQSFAPMLTFVAFQVKAQIQGTPSLSTNQALTSLATITLMTTPAATLLNAIPETLSAMGCFERIQKFLVAPQREDSRSLLTAQKPRSWESLQPKSTTNIELRQLSTNGYSSINRASLATTELLAVRLRNLTVRPSPLAEPAISDINMQINTSMITILTGQVGSGKSTLLKSILGELVPDSGDISVSSEDIAYCSQTAWILNTSIYRNICGLGERSPMDAEWYQSVLYACALEEDLHQLPEGDQSVPGSRGLSLSGGQKQRIALARAVFSKPKIVLLDDVLSALDSKTERLVADRLFGPDGLFRRLKSTVLLVTYSTRHFQYSDHVIVLSRNGKISQQGSFEKLRDTEGYISNLLKDGNIERNTLQKINTTKAIQKTNKKTPIKGVSEDDVSDLTRKTGDIAVYKYYFKSTSVFGIVGFLTSAVVFVFTMYFPQIWLVWWTKADGSMTAKYISVYVMLAIGTLFLRWSTLWWVLLWVSPRSSLKLHQILLNTAVRAPQSFYAKTDTGVTLNRFSQDIGLIDRILPLAFGRMVLAVFTMLAQAAFIAQGSSYMAAVIPVFVLAFYLLQKVYLLTSRQLRLLDLEARSPVYSHFLECLEGLSIIRAFGWSSAAQEMEIERLDASQRPYYLLYCLQRWLALVLDLMVSGIGIVVVVLAVRIPSQSSGAAIGIALNNVLGLNKSLKLLIENWTQVETSLGAISRLKAFAATTIPEDRPEECANPPPSWPEKGEIEFRNVTASYGPSALALRNVSMAINAGQKIGICGRTGSGKSSLLLSLCRLIEIDSGTIIIDGVDLRTVPREVIRTQLNAIPQESFVLSDSVRVNADPRGEADDDIIITTLNKVGLWSIIEARGGLDAQMKAQPLSQGQHQLFCLARAMLRKGKILILDEATSNVDAETDALMQTIIRTEFAHHTIISVAHRLNTIAESDMVAVLHKGELMEFGSPNTLLTKPSMFRDLYSS
ncbi:putative multidrug resistance protein [Coleophoma crateriformis]|uniref:Putative multidrug resistance protein n=1 Tax=Coleophoma crateriformis TaxID=565419 RepID=A0A3D8S2L3_9HELO|nr:putative multidrug resistance protein [Coleophoma crateriformis]